MTARGGLCAFRHYEAERSGTNLDVQAALALLRGVTPRDVASLFGLNLRTAYRWRRELVAVETVTVDGWTASFARRRTSPPVRISAWTPPA